MEIITSRLAIDSVETQIFPSLTDTATQTIKNREPIELTDRDRLFFAEALLKPDLPIKRGIVDAKWYVQVMNKQRSD
jgi:hypothetical protein